MPYYLLKDECRSTAEGFRRIAREQVQAAIRDLEGHGIAREKVVHQVRKRCKKLRGLIRLLKPQLGKQFAREDSRFRDIARSLSSARDAEVLLQSFDAITNSSNEDADVRKSLQAGAVRPSQEQSAAFAVSVSLMNQALSSVNTWLPSDSDDDCSPVPGFVDTYHRCRRAWKKVRNRPTDQGYHKLRKWVKYHWYHVRLLEPLHKAELRPHRNSLLKLSELLGEAHDLAVLQSKLPNKPKAKSAVRRTKKRKARLLKEAESLCETEFRSKPKVIAKELTRWWQEWEKNN